MLQLKEPTLEKEIIKQKKLNISSSSAALNVNGECLLKQNPFQIGKLYRLRKLKPPILPFYQRYNNQEGWIGTTNGMSTDDVDVMLCIGSIHHPYLHSYSGIFLAADKIVGVAPEWITEL